MKDFKDYTLKEKIGSIAFLIWFIVSIILLIIPINGLFTSFLIGQYFFVFGLLALYTSGINIGILFYLVSLGLLIFTSNNISLIDLNYYNAVLSEYNIIISKDLFVIISSILLFLGFIFLLLFHFKREKNLFFVLFIIFNILSLLLLFLF